MPTRLYQHPSPRTSEKNPHRHNWSRRVPNLQSADKFIALQIVLITIEWLFLNTLLDCKFAPPRTPSQRPPPRVLRFIIYLYAKLPPHRFANFARSRWRIDSACRRGQICRFGAGARALTKHVVIIMHINAREVRHLPVCQHMAYYTRHPPAEKCKNVVRHRQMDGMTGFKYDESIRTNITLLFDNVSNCLRRIGTRYHTGNA